MIYTKHKQLGIIGWIFTEFNNRDYGIYIRWEVRGKLNKEVKTEELAKIKIDLHELLNDKT